MYYFIHKFNALSNQNQQYISISSMPKYTTESITIYSLILFSFSADYTEKKHWQIIIWRTKKESWEQWKGIFK